MIGKGGVDNLSKVPVPQCVGVNVFCVHEPQHAGHDPSFSYNIWCAKFYLRHTPRLSTKRLSKRLSTKRLSTKRHESILMATKRYR